MSKKKLIKLKSKYFLNVNTYVSGKKRRYFHKVAYSIEIKFRRNFLYSFRRPIKVYSLIIIIKKNCQKRLTLNNLLYNNTAYFYDNMCFVSNDHNNNMLDKTHASSRCLNLKHIYLRLNFYNQYIVAIQMIDCFFCLKDWSLKNIRKFKLFCNLVKLS